MPAKSDQPTPLDVSTFASRRAAREAAEGAPAAPAERRRTTLRAGINAESARNLEVTHVRS